LFWHRVIVCSTLLADNMDALPLIVEKSPPALMLSILPLFAQPVIVTL
jgi:hypothetical protein